MPLINLLIVLIVIGVVIWAVTSFIPMDSNIKKLIQITGVVIALLYILSAFGVIHSFSNVQVPSIK